MHARATLIVVALLVVAAPGSGGDAKDLEKLQGTWTAVSMESDGTAIPKEELKASQFVVKGDQYVLKGKETYRGALKLDPSKQPKAINATFVDDQGKEKGKAAGIYAVEGDTLKISWREKGEERPTEFASKPGSGVRSMVFKRGK